MLAVDVVPGRIVRRAAAARRCSRPCPCPCL